MRQTPISSAASSVYADTQPSARKGQEGRKSATLYVDDIDGREAAMPVFALIRAGLRSFDGGRSVVAGAVLAGFLDAVGVVPGAHHGPGGRSARAAC